jgi:predicted O-methyltransferase YrrM
MASRYLEGLKIQRDFLLTYLTRRQAFWALTGALLVTLLSGAAALVWGAALAVALGAGAAAAYLGLMISVYASQSYWGLQQLRHQAAVEARVGLDGLWRGASPPYSASPDLLTILLRQVAERKPKLVVELGAGLSTVVVASALRRNGGGHVISVDHWEGYADRVREQLIEHGLEDYATLVHAELVTRPDGALWYDLNPDRLGSGAIDLLIVDGPPNLLHPRIREPALDVFARRLAGGAVVLLDDVKRWDERRILRRWARRYPRARIHLEESERGIGVVEWNT